MVNFKEDEQLKMLNHSCAHLMAQAIKHLYPQAKFWVGPVVAEGFYYDVDLGDDVIRDEDIAAIEKEMKKVAKSGKKIIRHEITKEEALEMFKDDEYKLDLINGLEDGNISCYTQGDFTDLCRGPHVDNVKLCRHFKLLRHSGAYWKGDSKNKVLQRESTAYVSRQLKNWKRICNFLRKPRKETIVRSARIWNFSWWMIW